MDEIHDSATSENIGGVEAAAPETNPAEERSRWVARGVQEGMKRALQKLGLGTDLDSALEALESLKTPVATEQPGQRVDGDVRETEEFRSLAKEHREASKKLQMLEQRVEQLTKQADEARLEKLRAAALGKGVGNGTQVEAFVKLYGDRVRFGEDRSLEVLSDLPDGTRAVAGQTLDEFLEEAIAESKWLLAPSPAPTGAGSRKEPVVEGKRDDYRARMLSRLGVKEG